jgi:hypothetical protein
MGERGPAPRREAEVRRTNNKGTAQQIDRKVLQDLPFEIELAPDPLPAMDGWNDLVKNLWEDLKVDPARKWMTSADWGLTRLVFQITSDAMSAETGITGAQQTALLKHMAAIGITEQARLRLQKEITLFPHVDRGDGADVIDIDSARRDEVQ